MKAILLITAVAATLALIGWHLATPDPPDPPDQTDQSDPPDLPDLTLQTTREKAEIFRRAFWRDPTPDDQILHAERREWLNEKDSVRQWQWFIAIKPGPALTTWLREQNPFSLAKSETARLQTRSSVPSWFPKNPGDHEVHQSPTGGMTLVFDHKRNLLYATDTGHGFTLAASP
jgi:hypothetical protein